MLGLHTDIVGSLQANRTHEPSMSGAVCPHNCYLHQRNDCRVNQRDAEINGTTSGWTFLRCSFKKLPLGLSFGGALRPHVIHRLLVLFIRYLHGSLLE